MADAAPQTASPFTRYFLPGLVLGLIIGSFAGVVLTPILGGNPLPKPTGVRPIGAERPLREGEEPPAETQPPEGTPTEAPAADPTAPKTNPQPDPAPPAEPKQDQPK